MSRGTKLRYKTLSASTIPELLIVMIVSSTLFLVVMDSLGFYSRFMAARIERIFDSFDLSSGFYRLEGLVISADSLAGDKDRIEIFNSGESREVILRDSSVIYRPGPSEEVLFYPARRIEFREEDMTVSLHIENGAGEVTALDFSPGSRPDKETISRLRENENKFKEDTGYGDPKNQ